MCKMRHFNKSRLTADMTYVACMNLQISIKEKINYIAWIITQYNDFTSYCWMIVQTKSNLENISNNFVRLAASVENSGSH